ncbi:hypothetical protein T4C_8327 [Trichinella pseudospiralis]|uniref:Uncharacterized protein n=1 Tax=Trichinella pseudospiralis TaxID=6337 RepID=A0A0V1K986_TRIPS|nr:hypothetical protein T4C_8327 [Trichinella pseudospiralis]
MQKTTLWQQNSSLSIPVDRFTRKQGSRQNRIHSPTPPPTLYIRGSPPVNTDTEELLTNSRKENCQLSSEEILPSTSQDVRRRVELTGTYDLKKPLALKAWKRKMPQSCALEQTVGIPALPQALSNQSSTADQTTVNRQKPTTILLPLSTLCKHFEAATKIR